MDKSTWGDGPWQDEPDRAEWMDDATGLPCVINRNRMGCWCGYVGVSKDHPLFEVDYSDCPSFKVHGSLTFSDRIKFASAEYWFLGFDCGHYRDYAPALMAAAKEFEMHELERLIGNDTYRDEAFVRAQCTKLAAQLVAIEPILRIEQKWRDEGVTFE